MKTPKDLYDLIHSLTPNEKSYFKKTSAVENSKSKSYVLLFDIINEMEAYDEKILVQKSKKKNIGENLAKLKEYLYDILLDKLIQYKQSTNDTILLYSKLQKAQILTDKSLFVQANKITYLKEISKLHYNYTHLVLNDDYYY